MTSLVHLALTLFGFGLLIFFHELGHYSLARRCGMRVEEFSLGFGPPLLSWQFQGVLWRLRLLPIGGFVQIAGMDLDEARSQPRGAFCSAPLLARAKVILAGPIANILVALFLFCALFGFGGRRKPLSSINPIVGWLSPSSPLFEQGLRPGDRILAVGGAPMDQEGSYSRALISKVPVRIDAERVDFSRGTAVPLTLSLPPARTLDAEELAKRSFWGAQALLFQGSSSKNSPLTGFDIESGDRLIWADGEPLFSCRQLTELLSDGCALLTLKRGDTCLLKRVKKVLLSDEVSANVKFARWRHLQRHLKLDFGAPLYCLPCEIDSENRITGLHPVDSERGSNPTSPRGDRLLEPTRALDRDANAPLQLQDRILAVDGAPVADSAALLRALQKKQVALIFASKCPAPLSGDLAEICRFFDRPLLSAELSQLVARVGDGGAFRRGDYHLYPPIELRPRALADPEGFARFRELMRSDRLKWSEQDLKEIAEQPILGGKFRDVEARVNPNPLALMRRATEEPLRLMRGLLSGSMSSKALTGPVGVAKVIYHSWSESFAHVLFLMGTISLNLAVFNLLPIPVLDGGHLLFLLLEGVRGSPLRAELARRITLAFFAVLGALSLLVTLRDLRTLFLR